MFRYDPITIETRNGSKDNPTFMQNAICLYSFEQFLLIFLDCAAYFKMRDKILQYLAALVGLCSSFSPHTNYSWVVDIVSVFPFPRVRMMSGGGCHTEVWEISSGLTRQCSPMSYSYWSLWRQNSTHPFTDIYIIAIQLWIRGSQHYYSSSCDYHSITWNH